MTDTTTTLKGMMIELLNTENDEVIHLDEASFEKTNEVIHKMQVGKAVRESLSAMFSCGLGVTALNGLINSITSVANFDHDNFKEAILSFAQKEQIDILSKLSAIYS